MRCALTLTVVLLLSSLSSPARGQSASPWSQLPEKKTAWILLSVISADGSIGSVSSFKWTDGTPTHHKLPEKGDRIVLTTAQDLVIIDYATKKEALAERSPTTLDRSLRDDDYTKLTCPSGATLLVAEKQIGKANRYGLKQVWVRVTPPPAAK